jgi:tRNA(fMet)-specific endonuclease VapC
LKILLDTSALIEWERGNLNAINTIENCEEINTSSISAYETLVGLKGKKRNKTIAFFDRYPPQPFYAEDSFIATEITDALSKIGKLVNVMDILIAAQAKRLRLTILAKDKDYDVIKETYPGISVIQIKASGFGSAKGIGPFTKEDELDEH